MKSKANKTCRTCLDYTRCSLGKANDEACKNYVKDPWKLEENEARWTFKVKKEVTG